MHSFTGENGSKACKNRRRIYLLREGEAFPDLLSLPTGSLKPFTKYLQSQISKRVYELGENNESDLALLSDNKITAENFKRLAILIGNNEKETAELKKTIPEEQANLKDTADTLTLMEKVASGT
jgi:hypothetical protein